MEERSLMNVVVKNRQFTSGKKNQGFKQNVCIWVGFLCTRHTNTHILTRHISIAIHNPQFFGSSVYSISIYMCIYIWCTCFASAMYTRFGIIRGTRHLLDATKKKEIRILYWCCSWVYFQYACDSTVIA